MPAGDSLPRRQHCWASQKCHNIVFPLIAMAKKLPTDDLFEKSTMTFGEHLEELRVCLFRGVVGITVGCLIGFFVANHVVRFFQGPLERAMEKYYVAKTLRAFKRRHKEGPVEVQRMAIEEA